MLRAYIGTNAQAILVDYSLSAYLAMVMFHRNQARLQKLVNGEATRSPFQIARIIDVFPAFLHIARRPSGFKVKWLFDAPGLTNWDIPTMQLKRLSVGSRVHKASPPPSREISTHHGRRLGDESWGTASAAPPSPLYSLFGEKDSWGPMETRRSDPCKERCSPMRFSIVALRAVLQQRGSLQRAIMNIDNTAITHNFQIRHSSPVTHKVQTGPKASLGRHVKSPTSTDEKGEDEK
ncbi:hypothetical protein GQ43DRAFT_470253 [Delitschia confertaspora ATCC 74209]|uniref:Uncharacterized protein n=1 Tax=Delitschia confertaspora ATCC 74209 TaxID=1513339 RepID=A0A9P4N0T1_9PLEO|nr:hypothetical protein GQ43DRAFT_470253 [Delitschia confertaspora ATCC 74209]